jgi:hypothetical protein
MNRSYSKIRHIQESNQRLENRLLNEEVPTPTGETQTKTLTNTVATEGIKNVTPQMVSSAPFKGYYSGYVFSGVFDSVNYEWKCNGVEGLSGIRGAVDGVILTETVEAMGSSIGKQIDGKPGSYCVGFQADTQNSNFVVYTSLDGKPKCIYF